MGKLALEIERDGNAFLVHQADGEIRPKGNSAHVFAVTQDEENLNHHTEHHDEGLDHHTEHHDRYLHHRTQYRHTQYCNQEELPSSSGAPKPKLLPVPRSRTKQKFCTTMLHTFLTRAGAPSV